MSKYHDLKNKRTISPAEEKSYQLHSITRMIEAYYHRGEKLPDLILENINFTEGVFSEYIVVDSNNKHRNMKQKETIAQNIMNHLPLKMYEDYIDIRWLKTYESEKSQLMYSLIYGEKFDVINKFLDLISKEDKNNNFSGEVFEPIFHLEHNIYNFLNQANGNGNKAIKTYFTVFEKALTVFKSFYNQKCLNYKSEIRNVEKWHKEYEYIHEINNNSKLHNVQLYILRSDDFLDILKSIFNQYDNPNENTYLSKEYMEEAVTNGQEKIVTYYISELLKHNEATPEQIEKSVVKGLNEKLFQMRSYISSSFADSDKNDYQNTYQLKEVYEITEKYGNYKPDYNLLSNLILINNNDFQQNVVQKIIPKEKLLLEKLNINQWKHIGIMVEQIKVLSGKGFKESAKQKNGNIKKEHQQFVNDNPFEFIYIINQMNKLYPGNPEPLSEKQLDQIYDFVKIQIMPTMLDYQFDIDKFRLNNKLQQKFEPKEKIKGIKI